MSYKASYLLGSGLVCIAFAIVAGVFVFIDWAYEDQNFLNEALFFLIIVVIMSLLNILVAAFVRDDR